MDGGALWVTVHGVAKNCTQMSDFTIILNDLHTARYFSEHGWVGYLTSSSLSIILLAIIRPKQQSYSSAEMLGTPRN